MRRSGGDSSGAIDIRGDGGVIKHIVRAGNEIAVESGVIAVVHYVGKLDDGTVFDSSRKRGKPFTFRLGAREVILGWDMGVQTMTKGEICTLRCSPDYAYGSRGIGPIPPNSTLTFEVELLDTIKAQNQGISLEVKVCVVFCALIVVYLLLQKFLD